LPVSNLHAGHHNYECHYVGCLSGIISDDDDDDDYYYYYYHARVHLVKKINRSLHGPVFSDVARSSDDLA